MCKFFFYEGRYELHFDYTGKLAGEAPHPGSISPDRFSNIASRSDYEFFQKKKQSPSQ